MMEVLNLLTNEKVNCHVERVSIADIKRSKKDFGFDWESEYRNFKVFKLEISDQPDVVQAMISLREESDHIELSHIERRRFRDSEAKIYSSVTPILCAFACRLSFDAGFDGFVSFVAKSKLIEYYKNQVGAIQIGRSNRMYIPESTAKKLVTLLMNSKSKKKEVDLDWLLEQIGPRPLTNEDSRAFSEAIRKHKEREKKMRESEKKHPVIARKFTKSTSETTLVSEPQTHYRKSK